MNRTSNEMLPLLSPPIDRELAGVSVPVANGALPSIMIIGTTFPGAPFAADDAS